MYECMLLTLFKLSFLHVKIDGFLVMAQANRSGP